MKVLCLKLLTTSCLMLAVLVLGGCIAGQAQYESGQEALLQQDYDQAVMYYLDAVAANPENQQYLLKLSEARERAGRMHLQQGRKLLSAGQYQAAAREYQLALQFDGSLQVATQGLDNVERLSRADDLLDSARKFMRQGEHEQASVQLDEVAKLVPDHPEVERIREELQHQQILVDGVKLEVTSQEPITLNFNQTQLSDVFKILTQLAGINFILDEGIQEARTTLFLEKASFAQALELLLRMNNLDKKILNSKTIILYPNTRNKQKQFQDQIIQTFYLSHIDAKKAVNLLRTMLQVRKIYVQEDLNAIVLRDNPDVIRLARTILAANDRDSSEVMFELELIEVNHSDTQELGLKLSNYSIGAGLSKSGSGQILDSALSAGSDTVNLTDLTDSFDPFYTLPTAAFRFLKTRVNADILANPRIRVKNNKQAKVHVGTREPVITVTINDTQTSENVQYIDVGVKLDVTPIIKLDNTIETKLSLEVSNVSGRERTANGTAVITISSTNADTILTLQDGEQTIIGGLIRNDKAVTKNQIPLLGDIPVLGEAFNGTDKLEAKREILLSITPHIVKKVAVPRGDTASIWSGGEDDLKFGKNFGTFAEDYQAGQKATITQPHEGPLPGPAAEPAPATSAAGEDAAPLVGTELNEIDIRDDADQTEQ